MNKSSLFGKLLILALIMALSILPGCSDSNVTTVTQATTEWVTVTSTKTVSDATTVTVVSTVTADPVTTVVTITGADSTSTTKTTSTTVTNDNPYANYHGYLLDGYPEGVVPLFGSLAIEHCTLKVQSPMYTYTPYYETFYAVSYLTNKSKTDVIGYYESLLETQDEDAYFDLYGTLSGHLVTVNYRDEYGAQMVYLTVTLPQGTGLKSNPYHADFPEFLQDYFRYDIWWEEEYLCTSNYGGTIIASKLFSYDGMHKDAVEYYRALYSGVQGYEEKVVDDFYGISTEISGIIDDVRFVITVDVWGIDYTNEYNFISVWYEKPQS
ncbi:MAG: hypothetical protein WC958_01940 [Dehalococcoidales bacterium]